MAEPEVYALYVSLNHRGTIPLDARIFIRALPSLKQQRRQKTIVHPTRMLRVACQMIDGFGLFYY